ncbi:hypothetical protein LIER_32458 [Lithospermum erythrorhizon]|uniref:Uncharacterized protein n=1 Tax=Lithospermum erythrorhizon TaxID=34254 RepID=A0AAV3RWD6_LITER
MRIKIRMGLHILGHAEGSKAKSCMSEGTEHRSWQVLRANIIGRNKGRRLLVGLRLTMGVRCDGIGTNIGEAAGPGGRRGPSLGLNDGVCENGKIRLRREKRRLRWLA